MTEDEKLIEQQRKRIAHLEEMVRIFTVSLHTVHGDDHMNGGARMMLASMGRAVLSTRSEQ